MPCERGWRWQPSGQVCELREVVLRSKPPALLAASPKGTVPVLITPQNQAIDGEPGNHALGAGAACPRALAKAETGSLRAMQALIDEYDGNFKQHLDRYKYPGRYANENDHESQSMAAQFHRTKGARFLARLNAAHYPFGQRAAWADMAIAPFVRQFAQTVPTWFDQQPCQSCSAG